jgi:dihydroorotase
MRSTSEPARLINRPDLGNLSEGACADIAVLELNEGNYNYIDCGAHG